MNTEMEQKAIKRLKAFEPPDEPYYLAYSGGKDSDAIKLLAELAGVKYEAYHNLTSVDAPETVNYIKNQPEIRIERKYWDDEKKNPITMWNLIPYNKMPPTRLIRYCCRELKERGVGSGRIVVTGVRWDESRNRSINSDVVTIKSKAKKLRKNANELGVQYEETPRGGIILNNDNDESRKLVEMCYKQRKTTVSPIIDWKDNDVWEFLHHYGCKSNPLYSCGLSRIGCIGCPMAQAQRREQFERWPKYKENYIKAFDRMLKVKNGSFTKYKWSDGEEVFRWWMEGKS